MLPSIISSSSSRTSGGLSGAVGSGFPFNSVVARGGNELGSQALGTNTSETFFVDITGRVLRSDDPPVYLVSCSCKAADENLPRQTLCSEMLHWDALQEESRGQEAGCGPVTERPNTISMRTLFDPSSPAEEVLSKIVDAGEGLSSRLVSVQRSMLSPPAVKGSLASFLVPPLCSEMVHWDDICDDALFNASKGHGGEVAGGNPILHSSAVLQAATKGRMRDIVAPDLRFSVDLAKISSQGLEFQNFYTSTRAIKHLKGDDTGFHRFCTEMLHFDELMGEQRQRQGQPSMQSLFGIPAVKL